MSSYGNDTSVASRSSSPPSDPVGPMELEGEPDTDGWFDVRRGVTVRRHESWVFKEGHFKMQGTAAGQRRAICLHKGLGNCSGKRFVVLSNEGVWLAAAWRLRLTQKLVST